jgi:hypothetical protein
MGGTLEAFMDAMRATEQECAAWLALAAAQWDLGRVDEFANSKALALISSGAAMEGWSENPALLKRRQRVLKSLAAKLNATPPPPRKLRPRYIHECSWPASSLVGYRLVSGAWIVLHVVSLHTDLGGTSPIVRILEGTYAAPPGELRSVNALRGSVKFSAPGIPPHSIDLILLGATSKRNYPADRLSLLPFRLAVPEGELNFGASGCLWRDLDSLLANSFSILGPPIAKLRD